MRGLTESIAPRDHPHMTLMEKAARALCRLDGKPENATLKGAPMWKSYLPQALAVVETLREPSLRMAEAGVEIIRHVGPNESEESYQNDAANIWRFMIDAISEDA